MITITGNTLTVDEIYEIAHGNARICLSDECKKKIIDANNSMMQICSGDKVVYGCNTGFGEMAKHVILPTERGLLSRNIIRSHAISVGPMLAKEIVRAGITVRINALSKGNSGVQLKTVERLIDLINFDIIPQIPSFGSLACSGDLCLLSFVALAISAPFDENDHDDVDVMYNGCVQKSADVFKALGIEKVVLGTKEGLAVTNGSTFTAGLSALIIHDSKKFANISLGSYVAMFEASLGVTNALNPKIHEVRNQKGQITFAESARKMLKDSEFVNTSGKVQDRYSLRCAPQVHGVLLDTLAHCENIINREINAATDNPLIFGDLIVSGGNFHGEPLAQVMDFLKISLAEIAAISERRQFIILADKNLEKIGVEMLAKNPGLNSGYMITQYTSASLCLKIMKLATPCSVLSLPTCDNCEDHNSNGWNSAIDCNVLLELCNKVIAMEYLLATRAIWYHLRNKDRRLGAWSSTIYPQLVNCLTDSDTDHMIPRELEMIEKCINDKSFVDSIAQACQQEASSMVIAIPRGTKDYLPEEMYIKNKLMEDIVAVFKKHGAVSIDTPTYERRDVLLGKYGDQQKLVFDLEDQENTLCSLRYDLTVPFARYMAMNGFSHLKRYHIAKVFRRDEPSLKQGRYREFYQCDIDIAGECDKVMLQDAEIIKIMSEIYNKFGFRYTIKLNHKQLLDKCLAHCGIPANKITSVENSIDKLDKHPWEYVATELIEKGLTAEMIEGVREHTSQRFVNPYDLIAYLRVKYMTDPEIIKIAYEMKILIDYLVCYNCVNNVTLDMSLARGLDYYTGAIFEVVCLDNDIGVGSIGGGGRYDNLIGMYSPNKIPAVGVSIGIERVFAIIKTLAEKEASLKGINMKVSDVDCVVILMQHRTDAELNEKMQKLAMSHLGTMWDNNIKAELCSDTTKAFKDQIIEAVKKDCKFVVIIGENEFNGKCVAIKNVKTKKQITVTNDEFIVEIKKMLSAF